MPIAYIVIARVSTTGLNMEYGHRGTQRRDEGTEGESFVATDGRGLGFVKQGRHSTRIRVHLRIGSGGIATMQGLQKFRR